MSIDLEFHCLSIFLEYFSKKNFSAVVTCSLAMVHSVAFSLRMNALENLDVHEYFLSPRILPRAVLFCFVLNSQQVYFQHETFFSIKT